VEKKDRQISGAKFSRQRPLLAQGPEPWLHLSLGPKQAEEETKKSNSIGFLPFSCFLRPSGQKGHAKKEGHP